MTSKTKTLKNKVKKKAVDYDEIVKDFVGLVFHCPVCECEMHLHIAEVNFKPSKITNG